MTGVEKTVRKMIEAGGYSVDGLVYLLRNEFAARLEVYFAVIFLIAYLVLGVDFWMLAVSTALFFILIAVEALNTAIEVIIDRISPEISKTGKHAKDLGSLAVMCLLLANWVFAAYAISTAF